MASEASDCIAPYVDAFLELYHHAFAWLCESAERVEIHFLGPLSFSSNTEVLLPWSSPRKISPCLPPNPTTSPPGVASKRQRPQRKACRRAPEISRAVSVEEGETSKISNRSSSICGLGVARLAKPGMSIADC